MRLIKNEIGGDTDSLLDHLFDAIKDISPIGTNKYTAKLYDLDSEFTACQIVESGYYWENIKAKLVELDKIDLIITSTDEWSETPPEPTS